MATLASNQVEILVEAHDSVSGKKIFNNTHWWKIAAGISGETKADVLAQFIAIWQVFLVSGVMTTHYVVDRYRIRNIDDETDAYENVAGGVSDVGSAAGPAIPTSEAVTMQMQSGLRGRSFNGSVHVWGVSDALVENNRLLAPSGSGPFVALGADWLAGLLSGPDTWYPAVWSRKLSGDPPATDNQYMTLVATIPINLTMGIMRHRRERTVTA